MAINFTAGYSLGGNSAAPGVKNYWISTKEIASVTEGATGITAITTVGGDGVWNKLENALSEGDYSKPATAGSGGLEYVLTANYRIGGLDETKLAFIDTLLQSSRFPLIAEHKDGTFVLLSREATTNSATSTSGVGGGGATAIGTAITFAAEDSERLKAVVSATTLDAITD